MVHPFHVFLRTKLGNTTLSLSPSLPYLGIIKSRNYGLVFVIGA